MENTSGYWNKTGTYNEAITGYDLNGNIQGLNRKGLSMPNKASNSIDKLSYTYDGNHLKAVDDAITNDNVGDFYDNGQYFYVTGVPEYTYDANGNLIKDVNKGILSISYNQLNLPVSIDKTGGNYVQYQYDAGGNKRRQLEYKNGKLLKTTDFIGNFVYVNAKPAWNNFDEGRVVYNANGTYFAETYLKDHLGNIRIVFGFDGIKYAVRQVNSYYPFGMNIKELSANSSSTVHRNEYLYNGKMMQDEMGLGWLDYGARFYDPVLGRWHAVDPMAEKYRRWSPYNYCVDNPMRFVDPDGMRVDDIYNYAGKYVRTVGTGNDIRIMNYTSGQIKAMSEQKIMSESKVVTVQSDASVNETLNTISSETKSGSVERKGYAVLDTENATLSIQLHPKETGDTKHSCVNNLEKQTYGGTESFTTHKSMTTSQVVVSQAHGHNADQSGMNQDGSSG